MLKLGYKASAEQFAPRDLLDFSVKAEEVGFDSVMISDHFQPWRHTGGHAPYSFSWLGALGERTSRIMMGTSVVTPTFRYHPSIIAQAMGTLGALNPGRVMLGVGTNSIQISSLPSPQSPSGRALHVGGISSFVATGGGRPSRAVQLEREPEGLTPLNRALNCGKIRNTFAIKQVPWRSAIADLVAHYYDKQ